MIIEKTLEQRGLQLIGRYIFNEPHLFQWVIKLLLCFSVAPVLTFSVFGFLCLQKYFNLDITFARN